MNDLFTSLPPRAPAPAPLSLFSSAPVEDPELPDLPTAEGRGRCDWKEPGEDTVALLSLLARLWTGPPASKNI